MWLWTGSNIIAVANGSVVLPSRHNITHHTHTTVAALISGDRVFAFSVIIPALRALLSVCAWQVTPGDGGTREAGPG